MKNIIRSAALVIAFNVILISCKKEEDSSCITCTSEYTSAFDLCKESDGNAWVNGQNTHTPYDVYLEGLQSEGVNCGN